MPTRKYQIISVTLGARRRLFRISPSALDKIKHDLKQAVANKKIVDREEHFIAERALLAAAIERAHEQGTNVVRVKHVREGWRNTLQKGPGCDPPRSCIRLSVIERVEEIKQRSKHFREMMSAGE